MAVNYICKHCRTPIGTIAGGGEITEQQLGFDFLTLEERSDIITYDQHGDVTVKLICDYCREALEANPELNLIASPLQ